MLVSSFGSTNSLTECTANSSSWPKRHFLKYKGDVFLLMSWWYTIISKIRSLLFLMRITWKMLLELSEIPAPQYISGHTIMQVVKQNNFILSR